MFGMLIFEKEFIEQKNLHWRKRRNVREQYCLIKMNKTDGPPQGFIFSRHLHLFISAVNAGQKNKCCSLSVPKHALLVLFV